MKTSKKFLARGEIIENIKLINKIYFNLLNL